MSNCGECRHWGSMWHDEKSGDYVAPCRANAPVFVFGVDRGCWPVTEMYDRCARWKPVTAAPAKIVSCGHEDGSGECSNCMPF